MPSTRLTKSEIINTIADNASLEKKAVARIIDELRALAATELKKGNDFVVPGMLKLRSVVKPATQDRPGVNPFTKQPTTIKGKPASKKIRASALKVFKDAVQ